jgi:hypothetical protein
MLWPSSPSQYTASFSRVMTEGRWPSAFTGEGTLYHNLGIDPRRATLQDLSGRPQYLAEGGACPLPKLV